MGKLIEYAPIGTNVMSHDIPLEPNHNNFILVDDASHGRFGGEVNFRYVFQDKLRRDKSHCSCIETNNTIGYDGWSQKMAMKDNVPMLLIVIQGDGHSLEQVLNTVNDNLPVLIMVGSGGLSDTIFDVYLNGPSVINPLFDANYSYMLICVVEKIATCPHLFSFVRAGVDDIEFAIRNAFIRSMYLHSSHAKSLCKTWLCEKHET